MHFATCEPKRALGFIQRFYDVTAEDIPTLMDLIKQDKLRVLDPDFHSPCQIIMGKKGSDGDAGELKKALVELSNCKLLAK